MKKIVTLICLVGSVFTASAQSVVMEHISLPSYNLIELLSSGDTVEYNTTGDHFELPVRLTFSGVSNGDVSFRVKEISTSPCISDQICGFVFPDPNFQGSCWSPNSADYFSPSMSGINFAAGDTVIVKPQGSITCGACAQYRYIVRLNGTEIDSFDLKVCSTLSVPNQLQEEFDVRVYPNPSSSVMTIQATGVEGNVDVKIADVLGKVVYNESVSPLKKIDVSDFKNGVYLVTVSDNAKKVQTRRIVVKH
jgi:hypothetical protein